MRVLIRLTAPLSDVVNCLGNVVRIVFHYELPPLRCFRTHSEIHASTSSFNQPLLRRLIFRGLGKSPSRAMRCRCDRDIEVSLDTSAELRICMGTSHNTRLPRNQAVFRPANSAASNLDRFWKLICRYSEVDT